MERFARLIDDLVVTRSRNAKLALLTAYFHQVPDPDRGWALAALTDGLSLGAVKASTVRSLLATRVDPVLWTLSRDYVGDTAETASLLWPDPDQAPDLPPLGISEAVALLSAATRTTAPAVLTALFDRLDAPGRYALIKLATGALRVGVSGRLARTALAEALALPLEVIEEHWHGLAPPYPELFAWGAGGPPPGADGRPRLRPFMLAHPLDEATLASDPPDLADYAAEWKWDGIRVQYARSGGETRLFSRGGEDILESFPEFAGLPGPDLALDGELLIRSRDAGAAQGGEAGGAASFNTLQARLGRKKVSRATLAEAPAFIRVYDCLMADGRDWRGEPWHARRAALEALMPALDPARFDLSALIPASDFAHLARLREGAREAAIEGVMLKRRDAPYVGGRRAGLWFKWKREALTIDCVLMYAQRGSGKRSSFHSDFTFGCWAGDPAAGVDLLPVGKAYFGFTDAELAWLDRHVRQHTVARYGPVRELDRSLVVEVAFDSVHRSSRHKSGVAMRFPRISRIRSDKPAAEADLLETLKALIAD